MAALRSALSAEMVKFLIVGGVSFVVNQLALALMYEGVFAAVTRGLDTPFGSFNLALFAASVIAVEIAIVARFLMNDGWTFRNRREKPLRQRFVESNLGSFGSPLISLACVNILTPVFGIPYLISNAIGVALGLAWNWGWSSRVVWKDVGEPGDAAAVPVRAP
jgi:putative flippase GtrA